MESNKQPKINDLKAILPIIRKRKWLILLPWILVSAIVVGGSYLITPEFEAQTIISIDSDVQLSEELQRLLGIRQGYQEPARMDRLRSIYNEITSTRYISQLNDELQLDQDPALIADVRRSVSKYPDLSPEQITIELLQTKLQDQVSVNAAANDQIRLIVQSPSPTEAKSIANALGEIFIAEKHRQEVASVRSSQDFSDIQLQKYERLLHERITTKTEFEKEFLKVQLDESITSESNRSEITGEIDRTNNEVNDLRQQEREILASLVQVSDISTTNLELNDSQENRRYKDDLKQELRGIGNQMIRYTWSDPQILNSKLKQNSLLNSIESENRQLVRSQYGSYGDDVVNLLVRLFNARANLEFLYSKASYLRSALQELTDKMNLIPEYQARLNQLNQEILAATELRDRFKRQQESSSISQALLQDMSSSKYTVVEPAKVPLTPFKPDRKQIVFLGVVLGLLIGAAAATIVELMDSSFKNVDDVEQYLGLPILGVAPKIEFLKKVAK